MRALFSYKMGLDKFGRHKDKGRQPAKGPKGEGYHITPEGDYDLKDKRLKRVRDPLEDSDCANKRYVDSSIPIKRDKTYSFHQFNVKDLAYPEGSDGDGVNVKYLNDKCLTFSQDNLVDARGSAIVNVKEPKNNKDAVNKFYVDSKTPYTAPKVGYWSFLNKRLVSVLEPINPNDVVTLKYLENKIPKKTKEEWQFDNMRLSNITKPQGLNDAVTVDYLQKTSLCVGDTPVYDAKGMTISNTGKPLHMDDVVNRRYLKEVMMDLAYAIHLNKSEVQRRESQSPEQFKLTMSLLFDTHRIEPWKAWKSVFNK